MARITKADLVSNVLNALNENGVEVKTKVEATKIVDTVLETVLEELKEGGVGTTVKTPFGMLKVTKTKARAGRNPKTGEAIQIPERVKVSLKGEKLS